MTRQHETKSYRKKGLSVFLTVLMILSVVAMSATFVGTVAADNTDADPTWDVEPTDIGEELDNTSQVFTIGTSTGGAADDVNLSINTSEDLGATGATITNVDAGTTSGVVDAAYVDSEGNVSINVSDSENPDIDVTLSIDTSDAEATTGLTYEVTTASDFSAESATFDIVEAGDVADASTGPVEFHADPGGDGHVLELTSEDDDLAEVTKAVVVDRHGAVQSVDNDITGDSDNIHINTSGSLEAGDVTLQLYNDTDTAYQVYDVETTSTTVDISDAGDGIDEEAFIGENVAFIATSADTTLTISTSERTVQRGTGQYSEIRTVNTEGLENYINVTDPGHGDDAVVELLDLDLTVESDEEEYEYESGDSVEVEITGTSDIISGVGPLDITVYDEDDEVAGTATSLTLDSEGEVHATFDIDEEGEYYAELVAVDSGISAESDTFTVGEADEPDAEVSFGDITGAAEGDVATIELELEDAQDFDDGDVILWVNESDYNANITIEFEDDDFDGDRTLEIDWNTFNAGASDAADGSLDDEDIFNVSNYDNVTANIVEETNISHADDFRLNPAGYTLGVFGDGLANDRSDSASLSITERSTGDMTVHIAPNSTDTSEIDWVLDNATQSDEVAELDYLVVEQEIDGIFGYAIENGAFADDSGLDITFTPEESPAYQNPETFNLTDGAQSDNLELVADAENGVLYFVLAHSSMDLDEDDVSEWNIEFEVNEDNPYIADEDDEETVEGEFTRIERLLEISVVEDNYQVTPTEDAVIEGTSTLAPGTNVSIVVDMPGQFIDTDSNIQVQDDADRSWQFSTDYSDKEQFLGEEFSINVEDDIEEVSDSATGEFSDVAEADTRTSQQQLEQEISDLEDEISDLEDQIADLEQQLSDKDGEIADLEQQLADAESALADAEAERDGALEDLSDAEDEIANLEGQLSDANDQISQLESDLADAQADDDDDGQPAFGPIAALFALLAGGALLARRRL